MKTACGFAFLFRDVAPEALRLVVNSLWICGMIRADTQSSCLVAPVAIGYHSEECKASTSMTTQQAELLYFRWFAEDNPSPHATNVAAPYQRVKAIVAGIPV